MATCVLIHGMWHGGWRWHRAAPAAFALEGAQDAGRGWNFRDAPTGAAAMITRPEALAKSLLELAGKNP